MMILSQIFASYYYSDVKVSHNWTIGLKKMSMKRSSKSKKKGKFSRDDNQLLIVMSHQVINKFLTLNKVKDLLFILWWVSPLLKQGAAVWINSKISWASNRFLTWKYCHCSD